MRGGKGKGKADDDPTYPALPIHLSGHSEAGGEIDWDAVFKRMERDNKDNNQFTFPTDPHGTNNLPGPSNNQHRHQNENEYREYQRDHDDDDDDDVPEVLPNNPYYQSSQSMKPMLSLAAEELRSKVHNHQHHPAIHRHHTYPSPNLPRDRYNNNNHNEYDPSRSQSTQGLQFNQDNLQTFQYESPPSSSLPPPPPLPPPSTSKSSMLPPPQPSTSQFHVNDLDPSLELFLKSLNQPYQGPANTPEMSPTQGVFGVTSQSMIQSTASTPRQANLSRTSSNNQSISGDGSGEGALSPNDPEAEDKRQRNTLASAKFRARKREHVARTQRQITELETQEANLKADVAGLKQENGLLREMVQLKFGTKMPET